MRRGAISAFLKMEKSFLFPKRWQPMPTSRQNELPTRVGPGTPINALFKPYWQPVPLVSEADWEASVPRNRADAASVLSA
jgi:hypothetical protein